MIVYDPSVHPAPEVTVEPDPGTQDAVHVLIDGAVIARVLGQPGLAPGQIALLAEAGAGVA